MSEDGRLALPEEVSGTTGNGSLFHLTNRMNLNAVLASRLVAPRQSFDKYYADLLEMSPGWVPLLDRPPAARLLGLVTSERGSAGPVLIEFPAEASTSGIHSDGVVYVRGVELAAATAIHFPDDRSLREHRARLYGNVHPHDELLRVTPQLFSGTQISVDVRSPAVAAEVSWRLVDRVRGAINATLAYAAEKSEVEMANIVLAGRTDQSLPGWLSWAGLNDINPRESRTKDARDPDEVTFFAIYDALVNFDVTASWVPTSVIDRVQNAIDHSSLTEDDRDLVRRNLQRVRQLVEAEVEFEPFRATASGLKSAKALILVLLRPDLSDLLAWSIDETGADDVTLLTAAILAGRLRGLSRESAGMRSLVLDDVTAAWAVRVASDPTAPLPKVDSVWDGAGVTVAQKDVQEAAADDQERSAES